MHDRKRRREACPGNRMILGWAPMTKTSILVSTAVSMAIVTAILYLTWWAHILDEPLHQAFGHRTGEVIICLAWLTAPALVMAVVRCAAGERLGKWWHILIPAILVSVVSWVGFMVWVLSFLIPDLGGN